MEQINYEIKNDVLVIKENWKTREIKPVKFGIVIKDPTREKEYHQWYWDFYEQKGTKTISFTNGRWSEWYKLIRKLNDIIKADYHGEYFTLQSDHPLFKLAARAIVQNLDYWIKALTKNPKIRWNGEKVLKECKINRKRIEAFL
jgi:hypothetical protein